MGSRSRPRLGIGVVGCGLVLERYHLPALLRSPDWQVLSVVDSLPERREWARRALPGAEGFETIGRLLHSSPVQAVLIATPPATHSRLAIEALAAGRHVLVEKPLALSATDAQAVDDAAAVSGRRAVVGFNRRFRRAYLGLDARLRDLPPGALRAIHCELVADAGRWPSVDRAGASGGAGGAANVLQDVASHQLDLISWLTGKRLREVRAMEAGDARGDGTFVRFEARLDEGIEASGLAGHARFYSERIEAALGDRKIVALPGKLFEAASGDNSVPGPWTRAAGRLAGFIQRAAERLVRAPGATRESFEKQLAAFASTVRGDSAPGRGADAISGVLAALAVDACLASLAAGGAWMPVEVPCRRGRGEVPPELGTEGRSEVSCP